MKSIVVPPYLPVFSSIEWRMISGICGKVKTSVIGMMPQTLKVTQASVEKLRQTTSLSNGQKQEEQAPAQGQLAPALGVELEGRVEDVAEQRLAEEQPAEQRRRRTAC